VAALIAGATLVGVALATPPSGQVAEILGRGTTDTAVKYTVPKVVMVTIKVRVKVNGRYVTRTKRVNRTIDIPLVTCNVAKPCDVVQQKITYQPGGSSGWHSHPGLVMVVVTSGSLTRYMSDCSKETFTVGQTAVELGANWIMTIRNEASAPAEMLATLIVPAGTPNADLRIDQPAPATCNI
jgi:quercetin dioxygenase-like cupin family protein